MTTHSAPGPAIAELLAPSAGVRAETGHDAGRLALHYQPAVEVASGRPIALKALLRWEHPVEGHLSPRRFVPSVAEAGRLPALAALVLSRACQDLQAWLAMGHAGVRIDIELMQPQLLDPALPELLAATLERHAIPSELICLQVAETVLGEDPAGHRERLQRLSATGVRLALTRFGGGAFTIARLLDYPFDRINIGSGFIQDMVAIADDAAMADELIRAAHAASMRVGADGVETAIEYDLLRAHGWDEVQGPYFCRALAQADVAGLLAQGDAFGESALLPPKPRSLLLVDDEPNILSALRRLLRSDDYAIATANSGADALALLAEREFDVIVCDQRMPGMSGVEFFGVAKQQYPDSVRIILSGYTELQSVIDAVNQGSIYKFLCKPWDDVQLRTHIAEAFERKELADENKRLNQVVHAANQRLAFANRRLEAVLRQQEQRIQTDEVSLSVVREALHHIPLPVIGLDDCDLIVFGNLAAQALFGGGGAMLGCEAGQLLPGLAGVGATQFAQTVGTRRYAVKIHEMGSESRSRGKLLVMTEDGHDNQA